MHGADVLAIYSNNDAGGKRIVSKLNKSGFVVYPHIAYEDYLRLLKHADVLVGNSSTGIHEAPSFSLPTVNIGDRQARRPRAASVIDCDPIPSAIYNAIRAGLARDRTNVENPYGDGHAAERIVAVLAAVNACQTLVRKSFVDLPR